METKQQYIDAINEEIDNLRKLDDELKVLHDEGLIPYGAILVHGLNHNYTFNWLYGFHENSKQKLYGNPRKKTRLIEYKIHLNSIRTAVKEAGNLIYRTLPPS